MRKLIHTLSFSSLSLVALGLAGATGCNYQQECVCDCAKGCPSQGGAGGTAGSGGAGGSTGGQGGAGAQGGQGGEVGQGGQGGAGGQGGQGGAGGQGGQGGAGGQGGQGGAGGQAPLWEAPQCDQVTGTPAVTFSKDGGLTFAATSGQLPDVAYTRGLAVLRTPGHLFAETSGDVLRSTDGGCTWTKIGAVGAPATRIVAAGESRAYGFEPNGSVLYRVDGDTVTALPTPAGVADIQGLGVDRSNPDRLRIGEKSGALFESTDGGQSFTPVGVPAPDGCFYTVAFDPGDLDHVLCGTLGGTASVTFDGGGAWVASDLGTPHNALSLAVSPVDGDRVWLRAIELLGDKKGLFVSGDGGKTFTVAIEDGQQGFSTTNGSPLVPDVFDAAIVYLPSQLNVYRFDLGQGLLEELDPPVYEADAIAIAPSDPPILYVGLSLEINN